MHYRVKLITFLFVIFTLSISDGQDSLLTNVLLENYKTFEVSDSEFSGEGWDYIKKEVQKASNVLIGEDHATNEIPFFTQAVFDVSLFDNFYVEVDPYSTKIIEDVIREPNRKAQNEFLAEYKDIFSFYALQPEYDLLKHIVNAKTNLLGADQIVAYADRLIFQKLATTTENIEAKKIYEYVMLQSKLHLESFLENPKNPMFFMTEAFDLELNKLDSLQLSDNENQIIDDLKISKIIYKPGGHKKRIQLMKHYLMKTYPKWANSKNLFKYGAMHLARGESFLTIYDIGNLIANIAESNYQSSFHVMIIGESGMNGSPFRTFPHSKVNTEKGLLKSLKPFFEITESEKGWYVFDLIPARKLLSKQNLKVEDITLLRLLKGYDALVVIPELTPAGF